jgi:hypothetical protein
MREEKFSSIRILPTFFFSERTRLEVAFEAIVLDFISGYATITITRFLVPE